MVIWREWVWRLAFGGAAVTAGFFALTTFMPLSTRGDPIYDTAMLRARWYGNWAVVWFHLAALLGALVLLVAGPRRWWALAAMMAGIGAFGVITAEEGLVIRYGDLIEPRSLAEWRLRVSRWASAALAGVMAYSLWRHHAAR